jgi:hypothetical protein
MWKKVLVITDSALESEMERFHHRWSVAYCECIRIIPDIGLEDKYSGYKGPHDFNYLVKGSNRFRILARSVRRSARIEVVIRKAFSNTLLWSMRFYGKGACDPFCALDAFIEMNGKLKFAVIGRGPAPGMHTSREKCRNAFPRLSHLYF